MKKILFLALVAMLSVQSADAQSKGGNDRKRTPEQIVKNLDEKLDLTDEQEKQITALYTVFKKELSREERRTAMQEVEKKVTSLLTDEQKKAYEQMKKERPQRKRK